MTKKSNRRKFLTNVGLGLGATKLLVGSDAFKALWKVLGEGRLS